MKGQTVRLWDVFLIGPLMLWGGGKLMPEYPVAGGLLAVLGAGTIVYNGGNYLKVEKRRGRRVPTWLLTPERRST